MTLVLARIDQRLIHGIVVTQWAGETKAKRLMVVDDVISKDEAQKAAMRMSNRHVDHRYANGNHELQYRQI